MLMAVGVFPAVAAHSSRSCLFPTSIISPHSSTFSWRRNPNSSPAISVATCAIKLKSPAHEPTLANQLRLGRLADDGLSYKEIFIVRSYEVGKNKCINIQIIVSYLMDAASNRSLSGGYSTCDGFSATPSMKKLNLIMVLSQMHVEVYKYPAWNDVIEIETWVQIEGSIGFRHEWILKDYSTGEIIGRATGKCLLMNRETRRYHRVVSDIRGEFQKYTPKSPRYAFPDDNKAWLKRIQKLDDSPHYSKLGLETRPTDFDMNDHLSSVTYIGWILESFSEVIYNYELRSLTIEYKKECRYHDIINSLTIRESKEAGSDDCHGNNIDDGLLQFRHSLRLSSDGSETVRARTIWRKK